MATVPKLVFTPTPLPVKPVVIITQEAVITVPAPVTEAPNVPVAPTLIAPARVTENEGQDKPDEDLTIPVIINSSSLLTSPYTTNTTTGMQPIVSVKAFITTPLIWQGAVRRFQFVAYNPSTYNLTQVELHYRFSPDLEVVASTFDQVGGTIITQPAGLLLRWPQLAPEHSITVMLTMRVRTDVPNGVFLQNEVRVGCREGAIAVERFTLIMPPAELPSFRVHSR